MLSFLKCELQFIILLLVGLIILNGFVYGISKLLSSPAYLIWVFEGSVVAFALYFCYFCYQFLKIMIFGYKGECKNLMQRIASWLSSLT